MEKFSLSDYGLEKAIEHNENLSAVVAKMTRLGFSVCLATIGIFAISTASANDSTTNICHENPYDVSCPIIDYCDPYTETCPPPSLGGGGAGGESSIFFVIPDSTSNAYPNVTCSSAEADRKAHGVSDILAYLSTYPLFYISPRDAVEIKFSDGLVRQYYYNAEGDQFDPPNTLHNESGCMPPSGQAPWTYQNITP